MTSTAARPTLGAILGDGRLAVMLALGYAAGLPILLVFGTLSAWLRESGVPVTTIGMFSWLALAYSFKFVWSPVVDAFDVPVLSRLFGRRRAWMLVAQCVAVVGMVGVGLSDPGARHRGDGGLRLPDRLRLGDPGRGDRRLAHRRRADLPAGPDGRRLPARLPPRADLRRRRRALRRRVRELARRLLRDGGADEHRLPRDPDRPGRRPRPGRPAGRDGRGRASTSPTPSSRRSADLYSRKGALGLALILSLVALYRLPDFVAGVMANPLYIDLGFSKVDIANVSKLYGIWIGMIGAFAGGLLMPRLGLRTTLLIGAAAGAGSNLMFSWLALAGKDLQLLVMAISIDNFAGSFAGTALIAYMSGLTGPGYAATQYALLSSLYALPGKLVGGVSGFMVQAYGYPTFFALTAAVGVPVVLLCLALGRSIDAEAKDDASADEAEPALPGLAAATPRASAAR